MGKYLEIAQRALAQIPQDDCITEDQLVTADLVGSAESSHCEKRELSEISPAELREAAGDDWDEISNDPAQLETFTLWVTEAKQIEKGVVPDRFTQATDCKFCGPVFVCEGYPQPANNCPWCMNRHKGLPIPGVNE